MPHWIFPPPIYFEVAAWPFYAMFSAIMLIRVFYFIGGRIVLPRIWKSYPVGPQLILLTMIFVLATVFVIRRPPTAPAYPFPPRLTPVAAILNANIALDASSSFKGRILTAVPIKPENEDAWVQQFHAAISWAQIGGNDEMSLGLWYYRIPTLFEYNQFISPVFHALIKRALQRPPIAHDRNITIFTSPNARSSETARRPIRPNAATGYLARRTACDGRSCRSAVGTDRASGAEPCDLFTDVDRNAARSCVGAGLRRRRQCRSDKACGNAGRDCRTLDAGSIVRTFDGDQRPTYSRRQRWPLADHCASRIQPLPRIIRHASWSRRWSDIASD